MRSGAPGGSPASAGGGTALVAPLAPVIFVISRGRPEQLPPGAPAAPSPDGFEAAWREGQGRLAALLPDPRHQIATESDHYVQVKQPVLVVDAIRAVVDAVRAGKTRLDD